MRVRGAPAFRLLLEAPGDGQRNMAVDEALLEAVGADRSPPTLRLYGFSPPTLSLGRFQKARELIRLEALPVDGIRLVRRPTGGQAVLHDRELTYAVVLGRGHLEPFSKREVYQFIAGLLLTGLEALGIRARSGVPAGQSAQPGLLPLHRGVRNRRRRRAQVDRQRPGADPPPRCSTGPSPWTAPTGG